MPHFRSARVLALALFAFAGAGCRDITGSITNDIALFNVAVMQSGASFSTSPVAFFYQSGPVQIPSSVVTVDRCTIEDYPFPDGPAVAFLDAGTSIAVSVSGNDASLLPSTTGGVLSYILPGGTSIPFTPGDTITFTVPGAVDGAPPRTIQARTAEPFTPDPITIPSGPQTLPVTWTGIPSVPGSAMFYSLRYAESPSTTINQEIACLFADDGTASVSGTLVAGFAAASVREVEATRVRIGAQVIGSIISVVSSTLSLPVVLIPNQ